MASSIISDLHARDLARLAEGEDRIMTADARKLDAQRTVLAQAHDLSPSRAVALVGGTLSSWIGELADELPKKNR